MRTEKWCRRYVSMCLRVVVGRLNWLNTTDTNSSDVRNGPTNGWLNNGQRWEAVCESQHHPFGPLSMRTHPHRFRPHRRTPHRGTQLAHMMRAPLPISYVHFIIIPLCMCSMKLQCHCSLSSSSLSWSWLASSSPHYDDVVCHHRCRCRRRRVSVVSLQHNIHTLLYDTCGAPAEQQLMLWLRRLIHSNDFMGATHTAMRCGALPLWQTVSGRLVVVAEGWSVVIAGWLLLGTFWLLVAATVAAAVAAAIAAEKPTIRVAYRMIFMQCSCTLYMNTQQSAAETSLSCARADSMCPWCNVTAFGLSMCVCECFGAFQRYKRKRSQFCGLW